MKPKVYKLLYIAVAGCLLFISGCEKSEIGYYNPEDNAVRFPGIPKDTLSNYYSNSLFSYWFSFASGNPLAEYADIEVPVIYMGIPQEKDLPVDVSVVPDELNATTGQYEIRSAVIPAGRMKGAITLRVFNAPELNTKTRQLRLVINATADYKSGPDAYINAAIYWNNSIAAPATTNAIRTYNFLIQSNLAYTSTSLANYSPNAHKAILAATGWSSLPNYTVIYAGNLYLGYAKMVEAYLAEYNASHPGAPLLHDAGALVGTPVVARKY